MVNFSIFNRAKYNITFRGVDRKVEGEAEMGHTLEVDRKVEGVGFSRGLGSGRGQALKIIKQKKRSFGLKA